MHVNVSLVQPTRGGDDVYKVAATTTRRQHKLRAPHTLSTRAILLLLYSTALVKPGFKLTLPERETPRFLLFFDIAFINVTFVLLIYTNRYFNLLVRYYNFCFIFENYDQI